MQADFSLTVQLFAELFTELERFKVQRVVEAAARERAALERYQAPAPVSVPLSPVVPRAPNPPRLTAWPVLIRSFS